MVSTRSLLKDNTRITQIEQNLWIQKQMNDRCTQTDKCIQYNKKRDLESRMNIVQYTFMHIFDISRVLCNYRQFGVMPGTET